MPSIEPLASRMRPRNLDEFIGQERIIGPGRLLRRAIQKDRLGSIILAGPPGSGKTTLAQVIARQTSRHFSGLNAILAGVADIRKIVDKALADLKNDQCSTILFVDEVHRWNKAQQDALLPWVENGTITLIGATTENPYFEVNKALVSRSRIFELDRLTDADMQRVARAALEDSERGYGCWDVKIEASALSHLIATAQGDARSLLNALELAVETSCETWPPEKKTSILISLDIAEESIQKKVVLYDKDGDYHYDIASAFIKSIRGSDPDASLYWLSRMIYSGESPHFIFRRMLISACEDIGMADPNAITVVTAAAEAFDRVGMPEGQYHLACAALYLATAEKSNSILAYFDALKSVQSDAVPLHLKDANRDGKDLGHGKDYLYPHAFRQHWIAQQYLPDALEGKLFYAPGSLGYEERIREKVLKNRELQIAAMLEPPEQSEDFQAGPTSHDAKAKSHSEARWIRRTETGLSRNHILRTRLFNSAQLEKDMRVLVPDSQSGLIVWEAVRRCNTGTVTATVTNSREKEILDDYARTFEEISKPLIAVLPLRLIDKDSLAGAFGFSTFDYVLCYNLGQRLLCNHARSSNDLSYDTLTSQLAMELAQAYRRLAHIDAASISMVEHVHSEETLISKIFKESLDKPLADKLAQAEKLFRAGAASLQAYLPRALFEAAWSSVVPGGKVEPYSTFYPRRIAKKEIEAWFGPESVFGAHVGKILSSEEIRRVIDAVDRQARGGVDWPLECLILSRH